MMVDKGGQRRDIPSFKRFQSRGDGIGLGWAGLFDHSTPKRRRFSFFFLTLLNEFLERSRDDDMIGINNYEYSEYFSFFFLLNLELNLVDLKANKIRY